jgi:hypothetical protein
LSSFHNSKRATGAGLTVRIGPEQVPHSRLGVDGRQFAAGRRKRFRDG